MDIPWGKYVLEPIQKETGAEAGTGKEGPGTAANAH
jgi:hypothetical protein